MGAVLEIHSSRFGRLAVDPDRVLLFPRGLVGFSHWTRFVLLPHDIRGRFWILHSAEDPDLAFVVMDPRDALASYTAKVPPSELEALEIRSPEDVEQAVVLAIVTIPRSVQEATVNLRAPLIINPARRLGAQVILESGAFPVRYPLFSEQAAGATAGVTGGTA